MSDFIAALILGTILLASLIIGYEAGLSRNKTSFTDAYNKGFMAREDKVKRYCIFGHEAI